MTVMVIGMAREIVIKLPDVSGKKYADIAHGVWMLLQVAGLANRASVEVDGPSVKELNRWWDAYARNAPWQDA